MSPPSSGSKNKRSKKPACKQAASSANFLLGLFFDPDVEGDMFFLNVVDFQLFTQRYFAEDRTLQSLVGSTYLSENFK
jgi:hypothetical protein